VMCWYAKSSSSGTIAIRYCYGTVRSQTVLYGQRKNYTVQTVLVQSTVYYLFARKKEVLYSILGQSCKRLLLFHTSFFCVLFLLESAS